MCARKNVNLSSIINKKIFFINILFISLLFAIMLNFIYVVYNKNKEMYAKDNFALLVKLRNNIQGLTIAPVNKYISNIEKNFSINDEIFLDSINVNDLKSMLMEYSINNKIVKNIYVLNEEFKIFSHLDNSNNYPVWSYVSENDASSVYLTTNEAKNVNLKVVNDEVLIVNPIINDKKNIAIGVVVVRINNKEFIDKLMFDGTYNIFEKNNLLFSNDKHNIKRNTFFEYKFSNQDNVVINGNITLILQTSKSISVFNDMYLSIFIILCAVAISILYSLNFIHFSYAKIVKPIKELSSMTDHVRQILFSKNIYNVLEIDILFNNIYELVSKTYNKEVKIKEIINMSNKKMIIKYKNIMLANTQLKSAVENKNKDFMFCVNQIKTPMNAIMGALEIARDKIYDENIRDIMNSAIRENSRILHIVSESFNNLIIQNKLVLMHDKQFNLHSLLKEVGSIIDITYRSVNNVDLNIDYFLPYENFYADSEKIKNILVNLVTFIINVSQSSILDIKVFSSASKSNIENVKSIFELPNTPINIIECLTIEIVDHSNSDIVRFKSALLNNEYQDELIKHISYSDLLSFQVANNLVNNFKGFLDIVPAKFGGTKYMLLIELPVIFNNANNEMLSNNIIASSEQSYIVRNKNILVFEQSQDYINLLKEMLNTRLNKITFISDQKMLNEYANNYQYDIILLDLENDLEEERLNLCRNIKISSYSNKETPIVASVCNVTQELIDTYLPYGISSIIPKPYHKHVLLSEIKKMLDLNCIS